MEREEKVKEVIKGAQLFGEKLRRGVLIGKREGNSTPSPTWKFGLIQPDGTLLPELNFSPDSNNLSARKLGSNLWEMWPQSNPSLAKLRKIGQIFGRQEGENISSKELKEKPAVNHAEQSGSTLVIEDAVKGLLYLEASDKERTIVFVCHRYHPESHTNLREQVAASPTQQNLRDKKVVHTQQPLSPASYCSSMEMPPYRPAVSPSGSLFSKGKLGESSQSLRTSTELLKLLNRIWSLEEKHALDMSLVKMRRRELDQSQAQVHLLLQQKKIDQTEINNLTKRLSECNVATTKEKGRLKDAVKGVENKVEDEHKLRRNFERINHKLDKELLDLKSLLSNALRELERERKARTLLEDLCDEFAKGIRDYDHEVRSMKHKYCKDQIRREGDDRLILHIAEAWLDQRSQMKLSDTRFSEKQSDLDKLCFEIEGFLRARQMKNPSGSNVLMQSLKSFHLNEPASAPWKANDEDDSVKGTKNPKMGKRKVQPRKDSDPSTSLMQPEEHVNYREDEPVNEDGEPTKSRTNTSYKRTNSRTPRKGETTQRSSLEGKNRLSDTDAALYDTTARNPGLTSEVEDLSYKMEGSFDPSVFAGPRSPVKKWISDVSAMHPDPTVLGASSRIKSSSLKAKLLETRIEGQQSRPRTSRSSWSQAH